MNSPFLSDLTLPRIQIEIQYSCQTKNRTSILLSEPTDLFEFQVPQYPLYPFSPADKRGRYLRLISLPSPLESLNSPSAVLQTRFALSLYWRCSRIKPSLNPPSSIDTTTTYIFLHRILTTLSSLPIYSYSSSPFEVVISRFASYQIESARCF